MTTTTTEESLTLRQKFVALSDMLPGHRGGCPDLPGFPAEVLQIVEIYACGNLTKQAASQDDCNIYNFGVGKTDRFLSQMGSDTAFRNCTVFAFDPFVSVEQAPKFGRNVHFYPVGLWNGHGNRTVGTGGTLMSLLEILRMLNHTRDTKITFFRSDCEGCEYGWVKHAMDEDPTIFERIAQMFIEIHTVPVRGMPALPLPWSPDGEPPAELVGPLYDMMTKNFRVLASEVNPGYPADRNRVPKTLQEHGVIPYPCCREFHLVSKSLAGPQRQDSDKKDCERSVPSKRAPALNELLKPFATIFRGRNGTCPDGQQPRTFRDDAFCPDMFSTETAPLIYFFGAFPVDTEFLQLLAKDYPQSVIYAFDPGWSESLWPNKTAAAQFGSNVRFFPWGIYPGYGPRMSKSVVNGQTVIGELYTLAEIARSWTYKDFPQRKTTRPPSIIDLVRVDWTRTPPCVWERELAKPFTTWWGSYRGLDSIKQVS